MLITAEIVTDAVIKLLKDNISDALIKISGVQDTPEPIEIYFGERDIASIPDFPVLFVFPVQSMDTDNTSDKWTEKEYTINIIAWCLHLDEELLQRYITRYADAIRYVLSKPGNYEQYLTYVTGFKISSSAYSQVLVSENGYAQASRVELALRDIWANE